MNVEKESVKMAAAPTHLVVLLVFAHQDLMFPLMVLFAQIMMNVRKLVCALMGFASTWMAASNVSVKVDLNYQRLALLA